MNESNQPDKSDSKSSWKSLAGSLFGIQFNEQDDLDDLDLDSVAEVVEQMNADEDTSNPEEKTPQETTAESVSEEIDDFDFTFDDEEETAAGTDRREETEVTAQSNQDTVKPTETPASDKSESLPRELEVSSIRESFDDEDPFGLGIIGDDDDLLDSDEQDDEVAQPKPEKPSSREKSREPARKTPEKKPADSVASEPEPVESSIAEKAGTNQDDDFWDPLDDWDWDTPGRKPKPKVSVEEPDFEEESDESDEEQDDTQPKKRGRRRRRRGRSRKSEESTAKISSDDEEDEIEQEKQEQKEIDAADIDLLWEGDDEEDATENIPRSAAELKTAEEVERGRGPRKIRRPEKPDVEPSEVKGQQGPDDSRGGRKPSPRKEPKQDEEQEEQPASRQYKNIPTWSDAIGMIVRKKPHDRSSSSSSSNRGGNRGNSGGRRRSRQRND